MALVFNDHSKADSFFGRHSKVVEYFWGLFFTLYIRFTYASIRFTHPRQGQYDCHRAC